MMEEEDKEIILKVFACLLIGAMFGILFYTLFGIHLNKEAGNEICQQLAKYEDKYMQSEIDSIEASSEDGKLICTIPSYDSTQLIKFKSNSDN